MNEMNQVMVTIVLALAGGWLIGLTAGTIYYGVREFLRRRYWRTHGGRCASMWETKEMLSSFKRPENPDA